jgi:hypothetical protein
MTARAPATDDGPHAGRPRWLLLAHQLPTRPSRIRVKVWRRLQQVGAVPTRNSVYVLPNTDQCREDFEWIRSEIVALGGEATVFAAEVLSDGGSEDIVAAFKETREREYRALTREADAALRQARTRAGTPKASPPERQRMLRRLRDRFDAIERMDFCAAAARDEAAAALSALERNWAAPAIAGPAPAPRLRAADFRRRRWVTRPRPGVDRMASAWLIRRFIDADAAFAFVDRPGPRDVSFDMYGDEFGHHGAMCTFETLAARFGIADPVVVHLGRIVHDLDMKEARYAPAEAPAVARLVEGLRRLHQDDGVLLERGIEMFDALAQSFGAPPRRSAGGRGRRPRARRA